MKILRLAFPLLAVAVSAGCAMDRSSTSAMGAGSSEAMLYCKDGAHVPKSVGCGAGVERDLTPPATTQK